MTVAAVSCEGWGIRVSKHLHSDQAKAFAEWWGEWADADPYSKAAFFAGWQASKADSHNHKVVVEYDLAPALAEGKLHDKLIELGWSPPSEGLQTKRTTE